MWPFWIETHLWNTDKQSVMMVPGSAEQSTWQTATNSALPMVWCPGHGPALLHQPALGHHPATAHAATLTSGHLGRRQLPST
jgi:hypothetical protein